MCRAAQNTEKYIRGLAVVDVALCKRDVEQFASAKLERISLVSGWRPDECDVDLHLDHDFAGTRPIGSVVIVLVGVHSGMLFNSQFGTASIISLYQIASRTMRGPAPPHLSPTSSPSHHQGTP